MNIMEELQKNHTDYRRKMEDIRTDWTRSDEAKRQDLEAAYTETRSTYAQLAEEYRTSLHERLHETRKAAFSTPAIPGSDKALQIMAYRDALERASSTTDQRELSEMLARAEMTGDTPLAKAILLRGDELQNEHLVGSYLERFPDERPKWDAFMDAAEESNRLEVFGISGAVGVPEPDRPRELGYNATAAAGVGGEDAE